MPQVKLPQSQGIVPQLSFHLQAVKIHRNVERGYQVFTVKNPVSRLHIQQLDGENVSRVLKLIER
jgi:hypothetical protein